MIQSNEVPPGGPQTLFHNKMRTCSKPQAKQVLVQRGANELTNFSLTDFLNQVLTCGVVLQFLSKDNHLLRSHQGSPLSAMRCYLLWHRPIKQEGLSMLSVRMRSLASSRARQEMKFSLHYSGIEARRAEKDFFGDRARLYLRIWMTQSPLSHGLDPAMHYMCTFIPAITPTLSTVTLVKALDNVAVRIEQMVTPIIIQLTANSRAAFGVLSPYLRKITHSKFLMLTLSSN